MTTSVTVGLLSGGIDSSTAATLCHRRGDNLYLLSINYGQVMQREILSARAVAKLLRPIDHRLVEILGFSSISQSARTDANLVQYDRHGALSEGVVPSAYPPGRDFTFLSMAAAWAETIVLTNPASYDSAKIVIGTNLTDTLDYPDCQPNTYAMFSDMLMSSLKMSQVLGKRIEVETPLIALTKQEVIALAHGIGVPLELTWSCYSGRQKACGRCDACRIRYFGFKDTGVDDPIEYEVATVARLDLSSGAVASR